MHVLATVNCNVDSGTLEFVLKWEILYGVIYGTIFSFILYFCIQFYSTMSFDLLRYPRCIVNSLSSSSESASYQKTPFSCKIFFWLVAVFVGMQAPFSLVWSFFQWICTFWMLLLLLLLLVTTRLDYCYSWLLPDLTTAALSVIAASNPSYALLPAFLAAYPYYTTSPVICVTRPQDCCLSLALPTRPRSHLPSRFL